jgi:hypothetical protein
MAQDTGLSSTYSSFFRSCCCEQAAKLGFTSPGVSSLKCAPYLGELGSGPRWRAVSNPRLGTTASAKYGAGVMECLPSAWPGLRPDRGTDRLAPRVLFSARTPPAEHVVGGLAAVLAAVVYHVRRARVDRQDHTRRTVPPAALSDHVPSYKTGRVLRAGGVRIGKKGTGKRECGMRISDCGMGSESRNANHESRKSVLAKRTHRAVSSRPA